MFLRKTVAINVISIWKYQKTVFRITKAILHNNYPSITAKITNISLFVKNITDNFFFCKQLNWLKLQSNLKQLAFFNLFAVMS